jgi:hypothetical protein
MFRIEPLSDQAGTELGGRSENPRLGFDETGSMVLNGWISSRGSRIGEGRMEGISCDEVWMMR